MTEREEPTGPVGWVDLIDPLLDDIEDEDWRAKSAGSFDVVEAQQKYTLDGRVVADVSYDFPRLLLATTDRWQLTVEGDFTFTHQGTVHSSLADQDEEIVALLREGIGAPIRRFSIHVDDSLSFELAGGSFRVEHDPELEAWSFIGPGHRLAMAPTETISPRPTSATRDVAGQ